MKGKIIAFIVVLAAMATLPLVSIHFERQLSASSAATADEPQSEKSKAVCSRACAMCQPSYCDEALHAALIAAESEYRYKPFQVQDISDKELYKRLLSVYNSNKEIFLTYRSKNVPIPYARRSNGLTSSNKHYPYICAVASPWDVFSVYEPNVDCIGISMDGINYLCENGMTAEEALLWYLPEFTVEK